MKNTGNERFNQIYINSRDRVYRTALYYTKNYDVAEEIMQETFMDLYRDIDNIRSATEENWLLRVAENKSLNWLTRMKNESQKLEYLADEKEKLSGKSMEEDFLEKERNKNAKNLEREIFEELQKENERWYEAVTRVYGMGRPQREVAAEMNISIEVLTAILYRARKWVRRNYGEQYEEIFDM